MINRKDVEKNSMNDKDDVSQQSAERYWFNKNIYEYVLTQTINIIHYYVTALAPIYSLAQGSRRNKWLRVVYISQVGTRAYSFSGPT